MLIDRVELQSDISTNSHFQNIEALSGSFFIGNHVDEFKEKLGLLDSENIVHFKTNGSWSMSALLSYVLSVTGKANVYLTSWAMSEGSARILFGLKEKGFIDELCCLLDFAVQNRSSPGVNILRSISSKFALTQIHAKCVLVQNEHYNLTILSSANFNQNPRIEVGTIFKDKESFEFHKNWIQDEFKK